MHQDDLAKFLKDNRTYQVVRVSGNSYKDCVYALVDNYPEMLESIGMLRYYKAPAGYIKWEEVEAAEIAMGNELTMNAYGWEPDENYTKGAVSVIRSKDRTLLDKFLCQARTDTKDNAFAIETSLCAVEKFNKGTRWNGYYTERMLEEAKGTKYETLIYQLAL